MGFWEVIGGVGGIVGIASLFLAFPRIQRRFSKPSLDKAVSVKFSFMPWFSEGVLLEFDEDQNLAYYQDQDLIAFNRPSMFISVQSNSDNSWIKLPPFFFIRVNSRSKLPEDVKVYVDMQEGKGGGGVPRYLVAVFLGGGPISFKASYFGDDFSSYQYLRGEAELPNLRSEYGFFTLEPGEFEEFNIDFIVEPGYLFDFSIGVPYSFEGKRETIWSERYNIAVPKKAELWTVKNIKTHVEGEEWGDYPENYRAVGLKPLNNQNYTPPDFDMEKARALFNASQSSPSRDFEV